MKDNNKIRKDLIILILSVILIFIFMILSFFLPYPTSFQYMIYRVIFAMAIAGIAASVPGVVKVKIKNTIQAIGALAVFFLYIHITLQF